MENSYPTLPILLVDDELAWLDSFSLTLEYNAGITNVIKCNDSAQVLSILKEHPVSMVILDMTMPPPTGDELLPIISQDYPDVPVVVLSGLNSLDIAVKCMKLGACDYYIKTSEITHLTAGLKRILKQQELHNELQTLKNNIFNDNFKKPAAFDQILTCSNNMKLILKYIAAIASSNEPVLITGESGVGKELVSKAIHACSAPQGPLIAVNVAGLDETAFSDTLFGHVRGAFTGADKAREGMVAKAKDGVLFLDEIGDLSPQSQVKLLRLLQEREYFPLGSDTARIMETRIVCATNGDLTQKQQDGSFRKDLYYRLCHHQIALPALRQRIDDLPLLLDHFINEAATEMDKKVPSYPYQLLDLLSAYHFPGNIRELRAMVFDAVSQHQRGILSMQAFKHAIGYSFPNNGSASDTVAMQCKLQFPDHLPTLQQSATQLISEALQRANGNQSIAARLLGISQPALSRRLKKQE